MTHKNPFFIGTLAVLFCLGCGSSTAPMEAAAKIPDGTVQKSESQNPSKPESLLTFDILGGMFKRSSSASSMVLDGAEGEGAASLSVAKQSLSLPETEALAATTAEKFNVDIAYNFVGHKSSGRLVVTAEGEGYDLGTLRHFGLLNLRFLFFSYAFKNSCFGIVRIDGEIRCEISGDYQTDRGDFSGSANCVNGPAENPAAILYITDRKLYNVGLDAALKIDGNYLNYSSYTYQGEITIDGVKKRIEDLLSAGLSCE